MDKTEYDDLPGEDEAVDIDFDAGREDETPPPPITFRLGGEVFRARRNPPGMLLLDLAAARSKGIGLTADALIKFLDGLLLGDDAPAPDSPPALTGAPPVAPGDPDYVDAEIVGEDDVTVEGEFVGDEDAVDAILDSPPPPDLSSRGRFRTLVRDPDRPISIDVLGEVVDRLSAQVSGRPTKQPAPSRSGQRRSGTGSRAKHR